ncbi:hypothetical protein [Moritella viscosa]|uniref:Uncharacterized protein RP785 n=1 Tax=Moritella viscosa TaxID=80854 RepID=A0ABY1HGH5_9GAMM|nr:hypothetical protein [Moritella viscosa]SGY93141.1 Uncharacterized protein RP785 [Moritella viscosa]SHO28238.1 Uncharacterized protein RP785 [Moritella viscosa]
MSNTVELKEINKGIKELTYLLDRGDGNHEAIVKDLWILEKKKISLSILSDDGLEFSPINQFNSESYGVYADKTANNQCVDLKCNFETFVVTKYHQKFRDCDCCNKSKDKMEIQVFMPSCGQHLCLDCFDKEMREEYLNDNCHFEIIELSEDIAEYKYSFSYGSVAIGFDTFTYYQTSENLYNIDFYQNIGLNKSILVSSINNFKLSKQELNFLKTQYNLKTMGQTETENLEDGISV